MEIILALMAVGLVLFAMLVVRAIIQERCQWKEEYLIVKQARKRYIKRLVGNGRLCLSPEIWAEREFLRRSNPTDSFLLNMSEWKRAAEEADYEMRSKEKGKK